jgi:hypothetical protein
MSIQAYERQRPRIRRTQLNWLLTALPAFPLALLVLRLWYLSRQDLTTMLLLVQYVSPLGMISALVITLIWSLPAVVLVARVLGGILLVSRPDTESVRASALALTALRMPDWVVWLAVGLAGFTWQMRMLPLLIMLVVAFLGLSAVQRYPGWPALLNVTAIAMPIAVGVAELVWIWPGLRSAHAAGDTGTLLLLGVPPLLGPLLTGPVPPRFARMATEWPAIAALAVAPLVVGVTFLRAPVLPGSAVETRAEGKGAPTRVIRGQIITVEDTTTTILGSGGDVVFVPNSEIVSKVLCSDPLRTLHSRINVRGWAVDQSALEWAAPAKPATGVVDPRCLGRPLVVG